MTHKKITAQDGYIFVRIHDNFKMSNEITLGYDLLQRVSNVKTKKNIIDKKLHQKLK